MFILICLKTLQINNVEVQKITMLYQGPKQPKGLREQSMWASNKEKGEEVQTH